MLIEMGIVLKIMIETIINLVPYGLLALFPTMVFTRLVTASWKS